MNITGSLSIKGLRQKPLVREIIKARYLYLLIIPCLAFYLIFHYIPIYGVTLAFKQYKANLGILGSPFIGLVNYHYVFKDPAFFNALKNTLIISLCRILFQFPIPVIIALMLNELRSGKYQRVLQTIYTFPNFLSWVIIGGIMVNFLGDHGAINGLIAMLGGEKAQFLSKSNIFIPLLYVTDIWKSAGWSSIIYLAAITGIDVEQFEAAYMDGVSRFQKLIYIVLPGIKSTIVVMLILAFGNVMNAGFDQIFNISNPAVRDSSDIIDTYIYRITFDDGSTDFSFSTAVGLFKSVINFILLITCDRLAKLFGERGLYY